MLPLAEATGRCEIRPNSYVAQVEVGRDGRADGVTYFDAQKRMQRQRAKAVVLCANGSETPRLLLNSASSRFPQGLANSSGVVGKYLMFNTYFEVNAQFEHPLNEYKSIQNTRMVLDFYETDPKRGFYGGGGIDGRFGKYPITFALDGLPPGAPTWGEGFARELGNQFTRTMAFGCHGTSLPLESNSITLDPALKDAWGLPCFRATYTDHPDDLKNATFLGGHAADIAHAAGALKVVDQYRSGRRRWPSTSWAHVEWATTLARPWSIGTTERTTCGTCSSATAAAWSPRLEDNRPRRFPRWRSALASTSRSSPNAARSEARARDLARERRCRVFVTRPAIPPLLRSEVAPPAATRWRPPGARR